MKFYRPLPIDKELKISPNALIISKTDSEGNILYTNSNLTKFSSYSKEELQDAPHSLLRHPDMPRVIYFLLWEELKLGRDVTLLVKNLAKTGEYYWIHNEFMVTKNDLIYHSTYSVTGEVPSKRAITQINKLYKILLKIEKKENMEASLFYLENYLQERQVTLQEYMSNILKPQTVIESLFTKIRNTLVAA